MGPRKVMQCVRHVKATYKFYFSLLLFYYLTSFTVTETLTTSTPHRKNKYVAWLGTTLLVLQTQGNSPAIYRRTTPSRQTESTIRVSRILEMLFVRDDSNLQAQQNAFRSSWILKLWRFMEFGLVFFSIATQ